MNFPLIHVECQACPIRHSAVCAGADLAELAVLQHVKSYRTYAPGAPLALAGDRLDHLSSLVSGCASASHGFEDGRRQTVGLLFPSDFIGRPGRATAAYDIIAVTEVTLCRFERKGFEALLHESPGLSARLLEMTLDELEAAHELAVTLGRRTAREKVASFLVSLGRRQRTVRKVDVPQSPLVIALPLTRADIADHLGLTIETVSRQLTRLRKDGLISLVGTRDIGVADFGRLAAAAGIDDTL
jgi:CRP/FNR family transcriptional regulator